MQRQEVCGSSLGCNSLVTSVLQEEELRTIVPRPPRRGSSAAYFIGCIEVCRVARPPSLGEGG